MYVIKYRFNNSRTTLSLRAYTDSYAFNLYRRICKQITRKGGWYATLYEIAADLSPKCISEYDLLERLHVVHYPISRTRR